MTDPKLINFGEDGWLTEWETTKDGTKKLQPVWQCPKGCTFFPGQPIRFASWTRTQCTECGTWCQRIYLGKGGHLVLAGEPSKESWDG